MVTVADTAFSIAVVRAEEGERPVAERLFEDPYGAFFREAGAHAAEATQRYLDLPFFRDGVRLRTRFIDDAVRDGLAAGLSQVVLLGAGFDMRALRLPEVAARGASVFEVDTPDQLDRKRAILATAGVTLPSSVAYLPFDFDARDLSTSLLGELTARGFRARAGAIFVWEGVIGYIDNAAIDASLTFMAGAGGPDARVIFTFGDGSFAPESPAQRTARAGFASCEEMGLDAVWRRYLPGEPPPYAGVSRVGVARV